MYMCFVNSTMPLIARVAKTVGSFKRHLTHIEIGSAQIQVGKFLFGLIGYCTL